MSVRENARFNIADQLEPLKNPETIFRNPAQLEYIRSLVNAVQALTQNTINHDQSAPHIILMSPNGTSYTVTVDDLGALQTVPSRA